MPKRPPPRQKALPPRDERPIGSAQLDQRTREARFLKATKAELLSRIKVPTPKQLILADRASALALNLTLMDERLGSMTDREARDHRMMSGAYFRLIDKLFPTPRNPPGRPRKASAAATLPADAPNALWAHLEARKRA